MACLYPNQAFISDFKSKSGKSVVVWRIPENGFLNGHSFRPLQLPCGKCVNCRFKRSREWAIRCLHEAKLHTFNSFITLTFNQKSLDDRGTISLIKRDFQLFMKRLRKWHFSVHCDRVELMLSICGIVLSEDTHKWYLSYSYKPVRFYHCGEYGAKHGRPHYHAILFNCDFPDKYEWEERNGHMLFRSSILESLWTFGYSSIGSVTFESAGYVARYIMKKITGKKAQAHYQVFDVTPEGEITGSSTIIPEYNMMSRKPGIAKDWISERMSDVYPDDKVIISHSKRFSPPRFYDSQYEISHPEEFSMLKEARKLKALKHAEKNPSSRLPGKRKYAENKLKELPRNIPILEIS